MVMIYRIFERKLLHVFKELQGTESAPGLFFIPTSNEWEKTTIWRPEKITTHIISREKTVDYNGS
jgi:hypothetical protein